jgi:hypothetical protein
MMSFNSEREDKAIEALISGALHPFSVDFTDEEIAKLLESECVLSTEGKAALARFGENPLAKVAFHADDPAVPELAGEFAAMHRSLAADEVDEDLKAELARQREEVLRRIREKRGKKE